MNKLGSKYYEKVRKDINARYIAGESVPEIAAQYKINARTVYYYLRDVSPEEKGLHIKNIYLRKLEKQQHGSQEENKKSSKEGFTFSNKRGIEPNDPNIDRILASGREPIVRAPGAALDPNEFVTDDSTSDTSTTETSLADFVG